MNVVIDALDANSALQLAEALESVLDKRTHKHNHLGDEIVVKGSLSKALKLPDLIKHLASTEKKRLLAKERLSEIWYSLSANTRAKAFDAAGLYEPKALDWDDPRSNRKPIITE